jgi:hypothetical protein
MVRSQFLRDAPALAVLAVVYFVAGKLGLKLALVHASATAVWPGTGIALAAFLTRDYGVWPGVWIGAFALNLSTAGSIITSVAIATGTRSKEFLAPSSSTDMREDGMPSIARRTLSSSPFLQACSARQSVLRSGSPVFLLVVSHLSPITVPFG